VKYTSNTNHALAPPLSQIFATLTPPPDSAYFVGQAPPVIGRTLAEFKISVRTHKIPPAT